MDGLLEVWSDFNNLWTDLLIMDQFPGFMDGSHQFMEQLIEFMDQSRH